MKDAVYINTRKYACNVNVGVLENPFFVMTSVICSGYFFKLAMLRRLHINKAKSCAIQISYLRFSILRKNNSYKFLVFF